MKPAAKESAALPSSGDKPATLPKSNGASKRNGSAPVQGSVQQTPMMPPPAERSFVRVLLELFQKEGVEGLYRGCAAQIFTAVTKSGILLTTKE